MPPRYYATVNCPACGTRFQTPVEQILDVRVDPEVRNRMLGGGVNVAMCPSCGTGGALNLPFIYHDPEKEVALLYLPVEVGNGEVERQQAAGRLTRQLMDGLPQEERKGYLFQPETFLSIENVVKRVLELEGVTEADMARNQTQREFLDQFMTAEEVDWPQLVADNAELLDEAFFGLLQYTMQILAMSGAGGEDFDKIQRGYNFIVEETTIGKLLAKRSEVLRSFGENPDRDSLLTALLDAPDEDTITVLVQSGVSLMDYGFFQTLVQRMEAAEDPAEQQKLAELRRTILRIRDEIMEASQQVARDRAALLDKLLATEDPLRMARSYLSELDDALALVLRSEITAARNRGDDKAFEALQRIGQVINQVTEENLPPEVMLARRLLTAPSEAAMRELLQNNAPLLQPPFFQFLDSLTATTREQGEPETAEQLDKIRAIATEYAPQPAPEPQPDVPETPQAPPASPDSETRTPSGLIIAKH